MCNAFEAAKLFKAPEDRVMEQQQRTIERLTEEKRRLQRTRDEWMKTAAIAVLVATSEAFILIAVMIHLIAGLI